jgi:RNA polymerase sigma-70 factor, ECF subfamily
VPLLTEDRALLAAFRAGDRNALEKVYHHYVGGVARRLRMGFSVPGDRGSVIFGFKQPFELESAVQEVFLRAFKESARLSYDGIRPYKDFLAGITKHVVLDELRRRSRRRTESMSDLDLDRIAHVDEGTSPEATLETKQAIETVETFLEKECDERDRKLYELRYRDERSQEESAKAAGLTRIQVRRWETKFRTRMLKYLKRVRYV